MSDNPFQGEPDDPIDSEDGLYTEHELRLANRNSGILLEMLELDVTPTGSHYLLNHFDVPIIQPRQHKLRFSGAFHAPKELSLGHIEAMPQVTVPVTLECAGNGRAGVSPRAHSMPWIYEAVGASEWTGTPLKPLLAEVGLQPEAVEIAFMGADFGYDMGVGHFYGRSLIRQQLDELDVLLVYAMNGQPLLPQHGAPLRLIVPGWYGMAGVKWLDEIKALREPFDGFQQARNYHFRTSSQDDGTAVTILRVKSLMTPPGKPDWGTRQRLVEPGLLTLTGRAWSGGGVPVRKVEVLLDGEWQTADLTASQGRYGWTRWSCKWLATTGKHVLRCRATDADGNVQPLDPPWDVAGFGNNAAQSVHVHVAPPPAHSNGADVRSPRSASS